MKTQLQLSDLIGALGDGTQAFVKSTNLISVPNTTIQNRAQIADVSNDLKVRMGIDRVAIQQAAQLQNEFGPNGESVFSVPNDERFRFVGGWVVSDDAAGPAITSGTTGNDYFEVTFYGTGLNLLTGGLNFVRDIRASVDGGTESGTLAPTATGGSLHGRNYAANQVIPVASGLTLGIHTIKIRSASVTAGMYVHGVEILNESSLVKVNPGSAYLAGSRCTSLSASSSPYATTFENISDGAVGVRGGRALVYGKSNGTIAKAFTPVNAATAYLNSADHTSEEVVRNYFPREFGAGRGATGTPDDFSLEGATPRSRMFTLDDGVTTLVGINSFVTLNSGKEAAGVSNSASNYLAFTFVGTGLDLELIGTSSGTFSSVQIDGTASVGTLAPTANYQVLRVVSGLPYGTHTVRLTAAGVAAAVSRFIVYQPKKPTLPVGAIELADYNVMASFVANATAGMDTMSTGVLRKHVARELLYIGTWTIAFNGGSPGLLDETSATNGDYIQHTFFGTGFDFRYQANADGATAQVTINGLNATAANFATAAFSSYGTGSFASSTGVLTQTGSTAGGSGLVISGLPLSLYTVKIAKTGVTNLRASALDIITPIHSVKSNSVTDIQNTMLIGSCAISDGRQTSFVKKTDARKKSVAQVLGIVGSPSVTVSTAIPMPDMLAVINTEAGNIEINFAGSFFGNSLALSAYFDIYVDGVQVGVEQSVVFLAGSDYRGLTQTVIVPVSKGVHVVMIYWATSANTLSCRNNNRILTVKEL